METQAPTAQEYEALLAFLPQLYAPGFEPILEWKGGAGTFPYPEYDERVKAFYQMAGRPPWNDYGYSPAEAVRMLKDPEAIRTATLDDIRTMLTYCVRGERFGDGLWATMIEEGYIRQILERVAVLGTAEKNVKR